MLARRGTVSALLPDPNADAMLAVRPTVHQDTTLLRTRGDRPFRCFESGVLDKGARLRAVHVELLDWAELGELGLQGLISDRVNDTLEGEKKECNQMGCRTGVRR